MKVLLTALNAKYIHTNLAVRYLKKTIESSYNDVEILEFTINHHQEYILSEIYRKNPDVLCFSCYIWNIEMILELSSNIKKVLPDVLIVLGGPEVSFEAEALMVSNDSIDFIVVGEGEITLKKLLLTLEDFGDISQLPGILFRARGRIYTTEGQCTMLSMEELPFPYQDEELQEDKIIYYESSRGCPFNCQYCLSSTFSGVNFLPLGRVKEELSYFLEKRVRQVKFVDRTFNANKKNTIEILKFLLEKNNGYTNFHFEVAADLIDEEMLELLKTAAVGLFQFEIGVQSTNEETLKAIDRKTNFELLKDIVGKISSFKNIHQHLDLIVGLPHEDYYSFRKSFNDVFQLRPEKLQIGFLKLLKGSGLRINSDKYGYVYKSNPPYEVLQNDYISFGEIIKLKGIEEMVEVYWNSGLFSAALRVVIDNFYPSPFGFFEELWQYWLEMGYHHQANGKNQLYKILLDFYLHRNFQRPEVFKEILKLDYLKNTKTTSLPQFLVRIEGADFKNKCHEFLQREDNLEKYLPAYKNQPAKQIIKQVHFQIFSVDVIALEVNPTLLKGIKEEESIILFDYLMESKALDDSKYFKVVF